MEKLKALRSGNRAAVTRALNRIKSLNDDGGDIKTIQTLFENLRNKKKTIEKLDEQILEAATIEETENEVIQTDEYNSNLDVELCNIQNLLSSDISTEQPNVNVVQQTVSDLNPCAHEFPRRNLPNFNALVEPVISRESQQSSVSQSHRLPKLSLPNFSGKILDWLSFWDSFDSAVHSNPCLNDVQKFNYLKSLLYGEALQVIHGFALTNVNYNKAITLLHDRYGQDHKIIRNYMQALLDVPAPVNTLNSLRQFYDQTEIYVRGLDSLGQSENSYGNLLVPVILNKLPADSRRNIVRDNGNDQWDLSSLRYALRREISLQEAGQPTIQVNTENDYTPTAAFLAGARKNNKRKPRIFENKQDIYSKPCVFCNEIHAPTACEKVTDVTERIEIIKRKKLCFNCFGRHRVSECQSKNSCRKCNRRHHTSICDSEKRRENTTSKHTSDSKDNATQSSTAIMYSSSAKTTEVLLKTAIARVICEQNECDANILFDEGAQRSFITRELADKLHATETGIETLNIATFGDATKSVRHLQTTTVFLKTELDETIPLHVLIVPTIATPIQSYSNEIAKLPYLRKLKLAHPPSEESDFDVTFLIGADNYWKIVGNHIVRGNGPTAVSSKIGYLLSGPAAEPSQKPTTHASMNNILTYHRDEEENIAKFWEVEDLIVKETSETRDVFDEYQRKCITHDNGRYIAKLPWRDEHPELPTNEKIARLRTENVIRRLKREPEMMEMYSNIIQDQENRGFIEKITDDHATKPARMHYILHHPVKKDSATTPIRIVFDCSCRECKDSASLNDCLETNALQLNDVTTLLTKFRMNKYAVTTDIEKAFLQVGLEECDRDATRFFWLRDPTDPYSELITYRFKVVLFGATCSPFILSATLLKHFHDNPSAISKELEESLYVDNVITSFREEDSLASFYKGSRELLGNGGFNLRCWTSNNAKLCNLAENDKVQDIFYRSQHVTMTRLCMYLQTLV